MDKEEIKKKIIGFVRQRVSVPTSEVVDMMREEHQVDELDTREGVWSLLKNEILVLTSDRKLRMFDE